MPRGGVSRDSLLTSSELTDLVALVVKQAYGRIKRAPFLVQNRSLFARLTNRRLVALTNITSHLQIVDEEVCDGQERLKHHELQAEEQALVQERGRYSLGSLARLAVAAAAGEGNGDVVGVLREDVDDDGVVPLAHDGDEERKERVDAVRLVAILDDGQVGADAREHEREPGRGRVDGSHPENSEDLSEGSCCL